MLIHKIMTLNSDFWSFGIFLVAQHETPFFGKSAFGRSTQSKETLCYLPMIAANKKEVPPRDRSNPIISLNDGIRAVADPTRNIVMK